MADRAQVDRAYLSMIENNKRPAFGSDILQRVAAILGTSSDYLLLLTDDPLPPPEMAEDDLPPDVRFLYERIEHLPLAVRDEAVQYLVEEIERMERLLEAGQRMARKVTRTET